MTTTEQLDQQHQEDLQRLRGFRLLDDDFLTKCFEGDPKYIQLVLQIVLEMPDLVLSDVRTQVFVENLLNRSVRLDILATDSTGRKINVEIQRADKGAGRKRARYNSSMMCSATVSRFTKLRGISLAAAKKFENGSHILYVNGEYRDETPIGRLMHDFSCTNPENMYYDELAERVRFFKESKEGVAIMCKAMEDMRNESIKAGIKEGRKEGRKEEKKQTVLRMLELGKYALEEVATISGLPLDEVKKLQTKQNL